MRRRSDDATTALNWKAPPEWDRFLDAVAADNHGYTSPYAGIAIERAWPNFREEHPAEEYANRLLEAVGRRGQDTREKIPQTRPVDSSDNGRRATVKVLSEIKEDMAAYAAETGSAKHEVLRGVVCWYLDGGLSSRLTDKLEVAVPDAETQLEGSDTGNDADLLERRTRAICNALKDDDGEYPGGFTMREYADAVETGPKGLSDGYGEPATEKYLPRVLERLNYGEHPSESDLYVPEERAEEIAEKQGIDPDAPAVERKSYDDLTDDERAHGLRVELARRAANSTGTIGDGLALKPDTVRDEIFDGTPGTRKVKEIMDQAARADGFEMEAPHGTKRLRCNLEAVDADVKDDAGLTADTDPGEAGETDATPGVDADKTGGNDPETDVEAEMDRLMAATPATGDGEGAE